VQVRVISNEVLVNSRISREVTFFEPIVACVELKFTEVIAICQI
jgi:hypothetical protein